MVVVVVKPGGATVVSGLGLAHKLHCSCSDSALFFLPVCSCWREIARLPVGASLWQGCFLMAPHWCRTMPSEPSAPSPSSSSSPLPVKMVWERQGMSIGADFVQCGVGGGGRRLGGSGGEACWHVRVQSPTRSALMQAALSCCWTSCACIKGEGLWVRGWSEDTQKPFLNH